MPVQDNEKKKPVLQPEEEQKKVTGSQKLLPFLKAKAESHQHRLDSLDEKIAAQTDKIAMREAKIDRLEAKAERLEDINKSLKAVAGNMPLVKRFIEKNEQRIDAIRNEKIPKQRDKLSAAKTKLTRLQTKRSCTEHKLNRVMALNDVIKSFALGFSPERRQVFAEAMDRLNTASVDCLADKRANLISKKENVIAQYNFPETSVVDKVGLQSRINELNEQIGKLEDKISAIALPETHFEDQRDEVIEKQIDETEKAADAASRDDEASVQNIAEEVIGAANTAEKAERTADERASDKPKEHYETVNPDFYRSLSKEDRLTKFEAKETAREMVKSLMKEQIPYSAVVRRNGTVGITVSKSNADAFKRIESAVKGERAVRLVNPDFYKSLPKQERFTQRMTEEQAKAKNAELGKKGIAHSAVLNGDRSAVTVAKKDTKAAFFTRSKLKHEAARVSEQKQTPRPKQKGQGLE